MKTRKKFKIESTFVIGARPPEELSPKAKKQLSSATPSKKVVEMASNSAQLLSTGKIVLRSASETTAMAKAGKVKKTAVTAGKLKSRKAIAADKCKMKVGGKK